MEDFVEQSNNLNFVQDNFQEVRDKVDLYGMYYNIFHEHHVGYKKEDKDSHTEAVSDIAKLSQLVA